MVAKTDVADGWKGLPPPPPPPMQLPSDADRSKMVCEIHRLQTLLKQSDLARGVVEPVVVEQPAGAVVPFKNSRSSSSSSSYSLHRPEAIPGESLSPLPPRRSRSPSGSRDPSRQRSPDDRDL